MQHRSRTTAVGGLFVVVAGVLSLGATSDSPASQGASCPPQVVSSPSPGTVSNQLSGVLALRAADAWAVGAAGSPVGSPPVLRSEPLVIHWNGSAWRAIKTPAVSAGQLNGLAGPSSQDLWSVGHQGTNGAGTPLIEHWDGSAWHVVASPVVNQGSLLGVAVRGPRDVWAVGIQLGVVPKTLIEHWNGLAWMRVRSPDPGREHNELDSVVVAAGGDVWAVGSSATKGISTPLIARWSGSGWALVANPRPGLDSALLRSVTRGNGQELWAVGQSWKQDGSIFRPLAEHWDGTAWRIVASAGPSAQARLEAVAEARGSIWAVGADGSTQRTLAERLNHGHLSIVPSANRPHSDNRLVAVGGAAAGPIWAVGFNLGSVKRATLVERIGPCAGS